MLIFSEIINRVSIFKTYNNLDQSEIDNDNLKLNGNNSTFSTIGKTFDFIRDLVIKKKLVRH